MKFYGHTKNELEKDGFLKKKVFKIEGFTKALAVEMATKYLTVS